MILCVESNALIKASKAVTKTQSPSQKPQRTFLRKGQGLARFKGKSASNKTGTQGQESAGQSVTVQQRKEKKAGNTVSSSSQGNNKQSVMSGGPVAQTRVSSFLYNFIENFQEKVPLCGVPKNPQFSTCPKGLGLEWVSANFNPCGIPTVMGTGRN